MKLRLGSACFCAVVVLGAAGCGGGSGGGSNGAFTLAATQSCLKKAGYATGTVTNRYLPSDGGDLRVRLSKKPDLLTPGAAPGSTSSSDEYVFLLFSKTPAAALKIREKAVTLAVQSFEHESVLLTRAAARAGVGLTKNVFFYSASGPLTQDERTKVASCLR